VPHLARIDLTPSLTRANAFAPLSIVLTLAGIATVCDPSAAAHDVRGCPP
jgi:type IV fimbrial biogenesis protein FimT